MMKPDAMLINTARGPHVDEKALVRHLQSNPSFSAGLDVYEDEPLMAPGLAECENAVLLPHIASATLWTRSGMVRADEGGGCTGGCTRRILSCGQRWSKSWVLHSGAVAPVVVLQRSLDASRRPSSCLCDLPLKQAKLAACNVVGILKGYPVWTRANDVLHFVEADPSDPPKMTPSVLNASDLGLEAVRS